MSSVTVNKNGEIYVYIPKTTQLYRVLFEILQRNDDIKPRPRVRVEFNGTWRVIVYEPRYIP